MPRLRQKVHMKWREPMPVQKYNLRRKREKMSRTSRMLASALFVTTFCAIFLAMVLAGLKSSEPPPSFRKTMACSVGMTVFVIVMSYLGAKLQSLLPTNVHLMDDAIVSMGADPGRWTCADVQSWHIDSLNIDGQDFPVIQIETRKGKQGIIGIDPLISLTELDAILSKLAGPQQMPAQSQSKVESG